MSFFNEYYRNIVKYDILNKFQYKTIKQLPELKKIIVSIKFFKYDFNSIVTALVALEILTSQKGILTKAKTSKIALKIRKGNPTGCKITLRKTLMKNFISKIINAGILHLKVPFKNNTCISFVIKKVMIFYEMEKNYLFFKKLHSLNIVLILNSNNINEMSFLAKSYKI